MNVYRYSCPANRERGEAPWCSGLPCMGHKATRDQVAVAKALAWADGHEWWDDACPQRHYLAQAREVLHVTGPGLGAPR